MWSMMKLWKMTKIFHMQNELALRYSRISMDATDHSWFENYGKNELTISGFKAESGLTAPMLEMDGSNPRKLMTIDYDQTLDCLT
jgi:hypothetical protein